MRYVLSRDEEAFIKGLAECMPKKRPSRGMEAAFDYVSRVIARRRQGYIDEWQHLSSWTEQDWDRWLAVTNGAHGPKPVG
jgi:hypothetical protein